MRRHAEVSHEAAKLATTGFRKKTAVRREGYSLAEGGNTQGRQGHVFTETNVRKAPEKIVAGYNRGICRRDIELRNLQIRERTVSCQPERHNAMCGSASASWPCGVEDPTHA